ncbi:Transient receptor potential cation channel subfamily A member 1 [Symbiodinium microadriaticum]|uniref:Transient receptor potential cation channel subfamily A member 1 n=1 Tax=Symbiodinium microadriaticum TaxID=2951 RepID=A0A1Q9EM23_SYMMI|nr:Transient receptor potential cation channel subfamily A member 1 [Symbiodinium microadriaticum]
MISQANWSCLGRNGQTALHVAALHGETEAVKVLLSTQSFEEEVDRKDRWGRTALHCAVERGHAKAAVAIAVAPYS